MEKIFSYLKEHVPASLVSAAFLLVVLGLLGLWVTGDKFCSGPLDCVRFEPGDTEAIRTLDVKAVESGYFGEQGGIEVMPASEGALFCALTLAHIKSENGYCEVARTGSAWRIQTGHAGQQNCRAVCLIPKTQ